jgi:hypothetical protein
MMRRKMPQKMQLQFVNLYRQRKNKFYSVLIHPEKIETCSEKEKLEYYIYLPQYHIVEQIIKYSYLSRSQKSQKITYRQPIELRNKNKISASKAHPSGHAFSS